MQKGQNIWAVHNGSKGWGVRGAGNKRLSKTFNTKAKAVNYGINAAKKNHSEFIGQNKNGQIGIKNSYGHDPRNIKG